MKVGFVNYTKSPSDSFMHLTWPSVGVVVKHEDGTSEEIGVLETLSPVSINTNNHDFRLFLNGTQVSLFEDTFQKSTIDDAKQQVIDNIDSLYEQYKEICIEDRAVIIQAFHKNGRKEYVGLDTSCHNFFYTSKPSIVTYKNLNIETMFGDVKNKNWSDLNKIVVKTVDGEMTDEVYLAENYV